jgi:hypothetical protein
MFTQPPAAVQVAEHRFGYQVNGFSILGPFQSLLASAQVFQQILEPEQVRLALAHLLTHLSFTDSSSDGAIECKPRAKSPGDSGIGQQLPRTVGFTEEADGRETVAYGPALAILTHGPLPGCKKAHLAR